MGKRGPASGLWRCLPLVLLAGPAARAAANEPLQIQRDVAYSRPADASRRLDVYTVEGARQRPIVVWVHGGGWRRGDKAAVQSKPEAFARRGFAFVSINYRFVPQVAIREMAEDVAGAVRWVHDHAVEFGGDRRRIFLAGHSAGAHLVALVCTDASYLEKYGLRLTHIRGCIPVDTAAYDVPRQVRGVRGWRSATYTGVFGEQEDEQQQLSPLHHVAAEKGIPPFLILHVADRPDSTAQSQAFAEALRRAGVEVALHAAVGKTHATINRQLGLPEDKPSAAVFDFLGARSRGE